MSIAFNKHESPEAQATLSNVFTNYPNTLFVSAAGNATDGTLQPTWTSSYTFQQRWVVRTPQTY
ncbi:hypothetical protein FSB78_01540 [Sphingomonas ginsenosidivorax]|uniref:Uncharacterized protein n=1 Tax=Sphingomonas ginsenosidivorax TaxID=862135 RepID=A0A5C6UAN5_9SPHN|nr:hypothetical protein [Sphingomonas ginsenosidivorax]TXC69784.1 hypothetical protein FSB78_01540 [Sphingomonas ginsenosidivorax]